MKNFLVACSFLALISGNAVSSYAYMITDSFTAGIDPTAWTPSVNTPTSGPPATVVGTNNRVEVTLGGIDTSLGEPISAGGLSSNLNVTGNYMATVDFTLLNWDPILSRGIRVALVGSSIGGVERIGDPISPWNGNSYVVDFREMGGTVGGITPASTLSGSLMLVRTDDSISGWYTDPTTNGNWVLISAQENLYSGPSYPGFATWAATNDAIGRQIAFDNFTLTDDFTLPHPVTPVINPVPVPSTMLLMGSGLLGLVGIGRRRMKRRNPIFS